MSKSTLDFIIELHVNNKRQGPGSDEVVRKILDILKIDSNSE